jgi:hypothetical protein
VIGFEELSRTSGVGENTNGQELFIGLMARPVKIKTSPPSADASTV